MTATADQPRPLMADLPEPEPISAAPQGATGRRTRPRLREQVADNPLLTLMGAVIVALLVFNLGTTNFRFDDIDNRFDDIDNRFDDLHARIDDTNARIDRLEDRIDRLEDRMDRLEDRVIEIDRKLTALIAVLNATEAVDAALEGILLQPGTGEQDQAPGNR